MRRFEIGDIVIPKDIGNFFQKDFEKAVVIAVFRNRRELILAAAGKAGGNGTHSTLKVDLGRLITIREKDISEYVGRLDIAGIDRLLRLQASDIALRHFKSVHRKKVVLKPGDSRLPCAGRVYDEKEMINLVDSSLDFWLTADRYARDFESAFAKRVGARFALLANSGSSANWLAISALTSPKLGARRLRPGDEVITVAASFPTTVNPIIQNNLVPVFLDVQLGTYNIDLTHLEKAITGRTRAIFLAHTLGNPFSVDKVLGIAKKHGLFLVEDACDALGALYRGKPVGSFGDLGTFSFYPAHHITMGEGGAVVTSDPVLKKIVVSLRDWGRDCWCEPGHDNTCGRRFKWQLGNLPRGYDHKYIYSHIGCNLKVTDMQAAIGLAQLEKLKGFISRRNRNFTLLKAGLKKYSHKLILPEATPGSRPSWFGFLISVRKDAGFTREDLVDFLEKNKIATRMLFAGNITKQPAYQQVHYRIAGGLPNTDFIMNNTFWIGVYPGLDDTCIRYMMNIFGRFFGAR